MTVGETSGVDSIKIIIASSLADTTFTYSFDYQGLKWNSTLFQLGAFPINEAIMAQWVKVSFQLPALL